MVEAQRDQRIQVANANADAIKLENISAVEVASSSADRRSKEAETEKVATARALQEAYSSKQKAEAQRAERDKATQYANVVVQAEADGLLFVRRAEAEGLKAKLLAEADGTEAILTKKAAGFRDLIETCGGAGGAQNMLITEQLPNLVHGQVNAISNLKIDKLTVWDNGRNADGKTGTADFLSGMISALPPLHELARNAGLDLPTYLGELQRETEKQPKTPAKTKSPESPATEPPAA